ncbi:MAG: type I restriction enzyme HsdR N-terminal domain-containing protein [Clostridia bacterium]|nr:type I restriction enzyme HsdR N-terminal domain-containing protein [Clostridia bacterium]
MFNKFVWDTYLKAGGKNIAKEFQIFYENEITKESSDSYLSMIYSLWSSYCASQINLKYYIETLDHLLVHVSNGQISYGCEAIIDLPDEKGYTIEDISNCLYNGINFDESLKEKEIFATFAGAIEYYTTFLYLIFPDAFVPYYFRCNFNVLSTIANEFEIEIPPVPKKKDYKARFYYYGEICAALQEFRIKNNLSTYELLAFLYDFAPKYIGGIDSYIVKDLPEAKSAYFIGGEAKDAYNTNNSEEITVWQANPDTRAGDMMVMYRRTPVSAVDSVWRSVSVGFNDPFFYYYRCTYISNCTDVNQISQKQLQKDEIFKDLPIVRKNMQGINGVELLPSQYNHLMDLANADVPRLQYSEIDGDVTFINEKDVENKLVKELLKKLGYSADDYVQQLQIRVGNHNYKLIPDFVILPVVSSGHYSASFLIEAKLSIPTLSLLEETKIQARSYAKQLGAKYSVIASKEKVWITEQSDDYSENIFVATWNEMNNSDIFYEIFKMLGKKK